MLLYMFTTSVIRTTPACGLKDLSSSESAKVRHEYPYIPLKHLRTPSIPITDLNRNKGLGINFDTLNSYDELKMRRKAEYLKYRGLTNAGYNLNNFSAVVNNPGRKPFSSATLRQIALDNQTINCNGIVNITLPTNAGVVDNNFKGYYLSNNVPFFDSL
jgi:hypothetical protein